MDGHDLIIGNLEVPVCDTENPQTKTYALRSLPSALEYLVQLGVDVVSLANNHAMDQGETGLIETIRNVDSVDIKQAGAGRDLREAVAFRLLEVGDLKVGFMSAACTLPGRSAAAANKPGIAPIRVTSRLALDFRPLESPGRPPEVVCEVNYADAQIIVAELQAAKAVSDVTALALHWGVPMDTGYASYQQELARWLIDESGVDLILGCHPHVLQTIERYRDSVILYSMGHLIASMQQIRDFYDRLRGLNIARWDRTAVFSLTWSPDGRRWGVDIWPVELDENGFPRQPSIGVSRRILDELEDLFLASGEEPVRYDNRIALA